MPEEKRDDTRAAIESFLLFLFHTWAFSIEVFARRNFGERYVGFQGPAVLLLVPFYCVFWEDFNVGPMLLFLLGYLVMCLVARAEIIMRRRRGEPGGHSYSSGWPRLMRFFPHMEVRRFQSTIEPLIVVAIGVVIGLCSIPLGVYLVLGAVCMGAKINSEVAIEHKLDLDLSDLMIEQEDRAERFRDNRRYRR